MSVATQKSWQFVNTTFVKKLKDRVRPVFFYEKLMCHNCATPTPFQSLLISLIRKMAQQRPNNTLILIYFIFT